MLIPYILLWNNCDSVGINVLLASLIRPRNYKTFTHDYCDNQQSFLTFYCHLSSITSKYAFNRPSFKNIKS